MDIRLGKAIGSGFLVDDGLLATNYHVVEDASAVTAVFADGNRVNVVGSLLLDPGRDIALLKLANSSAKPLRLARALPRKGEQVIALGAPEGLSFSASDGIVSGIRRKQELSDLGKEVEGVWIQTSAPISHGNSGGPLIDLQGRVVGINTMGHTEAQNMNFAISSLDLAEALIRADGNQLVTWRSGGASPQTSEREVQVLYLPARRRFRHSLTIVAEHDKFSGHDSLTLRIPDNRQSREVELGSLYVLCSYDGDPPSTIGFMLSSASETWRYLRHRPLTLLVDGEAMDLGDADHEGSIKPGYVIEILAVSLTLDQFLRIAHARRVEGKLGLDEFSLTNEHLEAIRDLASRLPTGQSRGGLYRVARWAVDDDPVFAEVAKEESERRAAEMLATAKQHLGEGEAQLAADILRRVVSEHPDGSSTAEATRILTTLTAERIEQIQRRKAERLEQAMQAAAVRENEPRAARALSAIEMLIGRRDKETVKGHLQRLIERYPGTKAAAKAKELLEGL